MDSVIIYLGTFISSAFFIKMGSIFAQDRRLYKSNYIAEIFCFIGCIIPCITAALRANTVGVDVSVYVIPELQRMNYQELSCLKFALSSTKNEFLFSVLIYCFNKYANIQFLYFTIEALCIFPVYYAIRIYKSKLDVSFEMLLFYLLFYNITLCVMRQGIAMALTLLAYSFLHVGAKKKFIITSVIAVLFHKSAIMILVCLLFLYLIDKSKNKKRYYKFIGAALILFFVVFSRIGNIIIPLIGRVSGRYAFYLRKYILDGTNWSQVPLTDFLCKSMIIFMVLAVLIMSHRLKKDETNIFILCLLGRYFVLFNANFYESMRMAFYFDYFILLFVIFGVRAFKIGFSRSISKIIIMVPAFLYWIYFIYNIKAYGTVPYLFYWN